VVQLPMGGAFGGKEDLVIEQHLALGALLTGSLLSSILPWARCSRASRSRSYYHARNPCACMLNVIPPGCTIRPAPVKTAKSWPSKPL
jgi:hypothetical protein